MVEATSRISLEVHQSTPQLSWVHQVFHCARQRAERMRGERHTVANGDGQNRQRTPRIGVFPFSPLRASVVATRDAQSTQSAMAARFIRALVAAVLRLSAARNQRSRCRCAQI
jgi:hypothetical protein